MADSVVIKEFLVALSAKLDEGQVKKFREGINGMSAAVLKLGTIIESTALAVSVGVARWASSLENLYFTAQRTNSTADQLQAFSLAARNFGASTDEALGSVEGLAAFLRENPGGSAIVEGWLGRVGLSMKGANSDEQRLAIIGKLFKMEREQGQWFLAHQQASQWGISDRTALAMSMPGFAEELAAQEKRTKGWQKVAEAAHRFEIQLQNLKRQFEQMMLGFEGPAMSALERIMTAFARLLRDHGAQAIRDLTRAFEFLIAGMGRLLDWLDTHGEEIQKRIVAIFKALDDAYKIVRPALDFVYAAVVKLDKITGGWSTNLLAVLATLRLLGATSLVTGIAALGVGLAKALGGVAAGAVGAEAWTAAGTAFGSAAALGIAAALGLGLGHLLDKMFPKTFGYLGEKTADMLDWARDLLDPMKQAAYNADPKNFYASHYPWEKAPAATGGNIIIHNDVTVHGNADPHKVGAAVADATEQRMNRIHAALIREFSSVVQ